MDPITEHVVRNYQVVQEVGADGYCRYFRAASTAGSGLVTLAMLRTLPPDPAFPSRFQSQLDRAAALAHPGVLRILHFAQERQGYYVVLEHAPESTLHQRVLEQPLPPSEALAVAARLAEALDYLHRGGFVHGALHPQAVFLDATVARLPSPGIARAMDPISLAAGSEAEDFLAPEQLARLPADSRSDLYTLGLLLWFMLTGSIPAPMPPGADPPALGDPLVDPLLARLLQPSPRQRPRSAGQVRLAIASLAGGGTWPELPPEPPSPGVVVGPTGTHDLPSPDAASSPDAATLGIAAYLEQRFADAARLLALAAASAPRNVRVLAYLGSTLYQLGHHQEAAAVFQKAVDIRPESGRLRYNLGNALLACGLKAAALDHFRTAWDQDARCTGALLAITELEKETTPEPPAPG